MGFAMNASEHSVGAKQAFREGPRWAWVAGALVLPVLAVGFLRWGHADLAAAQQELGAARQLLSEVRREEVRAIEQAKRAQAAQGLLRDAAAHGLGHADWAERRFNIKQAKMSRAAANDLLSEMLRSPDRLFGAEDFELSVLQRKEGLFSNVADPQSMVQVTVRGSLLFRTLGGRP